MTAHQVVIEKLRSQVWSARSEYLFTLAAYYGATEAQIEEACEAWRELQHKLTTQLEVRGTR